MSRAGTVLVVGLLACSSCSRAREAEPARVAAGGGGQVATQGSAQDTGGTGTVAVGGAGAAAIGGAGVAAVGGAGATDVGGAGSSGAAGAGRFVAVDGGVCCLPDEQPGCCMSYAGFAKGPNACSFKTCDGMPAPYEAWRLVKDEHGCKYWDEPDEWTDCCGCPPKDQPRCNPTGSWRIQFEQAPCGPHSEETITISDDADAGTPQVSFTYIMPARNECAGPAWTVGPYETSVAISASGCTLRATVRAEGCWHNEPQCEDLQITLKIQGASAKVEGVYNRCWCGTPGPEGTVVGVRGTAFKL